MRVADTDRDPEAPLATTAKPVRVKWGRTWRDVPSADGQGKSLVTGVAPVAIAITEAGVARWQGLHLCGSPWSCPWCAPRISDERRAELVAALGRWRDVDKATGEAKRGVALVTLTAPHTLHDSLVDLRRQLLAALRWTASHRRVKAMRMCLDIEGTIRATELTWGAESGWHLHFHSLWLSNRPVTSEDAAQLRQELHAVWAEACTRQGLGRPSWEHGVDVTLGSHVTEYVSKFGSVDELSAAPTSANQWGAAEEITLGALKVTRGKGRANPWGLLLAAGEGDELAARLWTEYACAMKGAAQLVWSKGLKAKLGVHDKTDEELAMRTEAEGKPVVVIPIRADEMPAINRCRLRLKLLEVAESAFASGDDPHVAVMVLLGQMRDWESRADGTMTHYPRTNVAGVPWSR